MNKSSQFPIVNHDVELYQYVGPISVIEQAEEECIETAMALRKMSRYARNENALHGLSRGKMISNVHEEFADIFLSYDALVKAEIINPEAVQSWVDRKTDRMHERMSKVTPGEYRHKRPMYNFYPTIKKAVNKMYERVRRNRDIEKEYCRQMEKQIREDNEREYYGRLIVPREDDDEMCDGF